MIWDVLQYFLSMNHLDNLFSMFTSIFMFLIELKWFHLIKYCLFQIMGYIEHIITTFALIIGSKYNLIKDSINLFCLIVKTAVEITSKFFTFIIEIFKSTFDILKGKITEQGIWGAFTTVMAGAVSIFVPTVANSTKSFLDFTMSMYKYLFDLSLKFNELIFGNKIIGFMLKYFLRPILFAIYLSFKYLLHFYIILYFLIAYVERPNIIQVQSISYNRFLRKKNKK